MFFTRPALRRSFATIVSASAAPYGYTITVWSAGALLIHFHGQPRIWEIFLFLAGAIAGFAALWVAGRGTIEQARPLEHSARRVLAGALDLFAVGGAVGAAALLAMVPAWVAWPFPSFGATAVYIVAASIQLALTEARESR